ncbi:pilus assembly protein PilY [Alteromonas sp. V450]|uniref:PilC/PilY family type IV pilus protein n=1 Tax=Alteromonas sp. V450 TaxID=1912139 RepID=UPI0008FF5934|nr:PilC/PilY family type IV pilus protein [Alteromonas sp. V450]OJF68699.1 pilus assembly protein PilY [Alteromonas sp. V450]
MKKITSLLSSVTLFSCIGFSAFGDDLDIYLGSVSNSQTFKPNVLFIIDSSGSMAYTDDTDTTRISRVRTALKESLTKATNINAGLMRFSNGGGPVIYPVKDLDLPVNPEILATTGSGADDGVEINENVNLTSSVLTLSDGTNDVVTGFHFTNIRVPRGATVTSATLRLTSNGADAIATSLIISAEASGDATSFSTDSENISARPRTSSVVNWSVDNAFPAEDQLVSTPDLSAVIQDVVDRSDWCGGNDINIIVQGSSSNGLSNREVKSFEASANAPQLSITYDDSDATGCIGSRDVYQVERQSDNYEENTSGYRDIGDHLSFTSNANNYTAVRFDDVNIPQGAQIEEAYLEFTASFSRTYSASMRIRGINRNDATTNWGNSASRHTIRDTPKTSASVTWNMPAFYAEGVYRSPDISSIVSAIVNRSGWSPGNKMGFVMDDFEGQRFAYTRRGSQSKAARLVVKYGGNAIPGESMTVRELLKNKVDEFHVVGGTPIVATLLEATNYYGGRAVDYGLIRGEIINNGFQNDRKHHRVSHRSSYVGEDSVLPSGCSVDNLSSENCEEEYIPAGATYISPVSDLQCQVNNHIVLLSDGEANLNDSVAKIQTLIDEDCAANYAEGGSYAAGELCGVDLVANLNDTDNSAIGAKVTTHTIGLETNDDATKFLRALATNGGGGYFSASSSDDLLKAFDTIFSVAKEVNTTFVTPGVAVNQLNRLTHRDELYYALFKPTDSAYWPGNLKRYRLSGQKVVDVADKNAISNGFFDKDAKSYWSAAKDGDDVTLGGAASKLGSGRKLYFIDDTTESVSASIFTEANKIHEDNANITNNDLGIPSGDSESNTRAAYLKWLRGVDVKDIDKDNSTSDYRPQMGDPIHSQPIVVDYVTETSSSSVIFVATNQGMIHSINTSDGTENFAIMPKSLLSNVEQFYNDNATLNHVYGVDGDLVLRDTGTKKYLYVGMRRGGTNYYAFDITNKSTPTLKFIIKGGSGDFAKLGQTWSRPVITKIKIGGSVKDVMIFGGGYSEGNDDRVIRSADSIGNALFIVDADSGSLLWSAGATDAADLELTDMKYSIPAGISVIDRDNDGFADHMYAADMGGQVFRFDIYNGKDKANLVKGKLLADFGGTTADANRRFYYAPDVTEIALAGELYYGVAIGSGWRASPLDTAVEDKFYMFKDNGVFSIDEDGEYTFFENKITESDLFDATSHVLTSDVEADRNLATSEFANKKGWFLDLAGSGEKVLASPLIVDYKVLFTTYVPAVNNESVCAPPEGNSRAYLVNLFNANAVTDVNNDGEVDENDRSVELKQPGIAPDPGIIIQDDPIVCIGTECGSAVITEDEDGNVEACTSAFGCLSENIFGQYERVQRGSWRSETERDN